jgi:hypothetical protein
MRLLVLDACVLIDLFDSDPSIIRTISEHVGPVHVASPVFDEVEQIDAVTAESLGLKVVDPSVELAMTAAAQRGGGPRCSRGAGLLSRSVPWSRPRSPPSAPASRE